MRRPPRPDPCTSEGSISLRSFSSRLGFTLQVHEKQHFPVAAQASRGAFARASVLVCPRALPLPPWCLEVLLPQLKVWHLHFGGKGSAPSSLPLLTPQLQHFDYLRAWCKCEKDLLSARQRQAGITQSIIGCMEGSDVVV